MHVGDGARFAAGKGRHAQRFAAGHARRGHDASGALAEIMFAMLLQHGRQADHAGKRGPTANAALGMASGLGRTQCCCRRACPG